mgnify:CR=1 FL=1
MTKQPTINGVSIGRMQKIQLFNIIANQQKQIDKLNWILAVAEESININKMRRSQLRNQVRGLLENCPEELNDK